MKNNKPERHEQILEAATSLFAEFGYQDTDMQKIADSTGVAKGTIYVHFPSKEALFFSAVNRAMEQLEAAVVQDVAKAKDSVSLVRGIVRSYVAFFKKHPEIIELFVQERAVFRFRKECSYVNNKKRWEQGWTKIFEKLLAEGKLRCTNIPRILHTINQIFYGIIFTNIFQADDASFETRIREGVEMLMYGIFLPEE